MDLPEDLPEGFGQQLRPAYILTCRSPLLLSCTGPVVLKGYCSCPSLFEARYETMLLRLSDPRWEYVDKELHLSHSSS